MPFDAPPRKKLIEVSMPLEAINAASAREKSIRHGHPSTLHLWWARRPLAACRAVLFGQLVDDPSAWPERFPTQDMQERERERLHDVIRAFVEWPGSKPAEHEKWERALDAARYEIARSVAWGGGEEPPRDRSAVLAYLAEHAPPVYDPFCGGGSIPLEAQRLGLRAFGSDLNPVAVLISKALVEIPPKFSGMAPVHPGADRDLRHWRSAQGLADDVRYYGAWMREQAKARINHLYPDAILPDGRRATVIAWLWARTVRSPDPAARGAMVPLASSFVLSSKPGKEAVVRVVRKPLAQDGWYFEVQHGGVSQDELAGAENGTKGLTRGFECVLTGAPIANDYVRQEGKANRLGRRLMALVADGGRGRAYLSPNESHERIATNASASWRPEATLDPKALGFRVPGYGLSTYGDLFTDRQLATLVTLSDLIREARTKAEADAETSFRAMGLPLDQRPLADGGQGAQAYADALATYLALSVDRVAMAANSLVRWNAVGEKAQHAFGRQALPMVWDYAETNPFAEATGSWSSGYEMTINALASVGTGLGEISLANATDLPVRELSLVISTDPPYYDNVGYADLSDFFYVWLRRSLITTWPALFRRLQTPKDEELVATPHRFGGKDAAESHFMKGMARALAALRGVAAPGFPLSIYYAFKQSENSVEGSAGWAAFLQAVVDSGLVIDGTWPVRTEMSTRMRGMASNALASSVVLACRRRPEQADVSTERAFVDELRRELPRALSDIRAAGLHPVDMPQSALGPGMAVFSRYAVVRRADDNMMSVGRAIALINQVRGEIDDAEVGVLDPETRFALDWFASFGWNERDSGEAIKLAQSYDLPERQLREAGVLVAERGKARLLRRAEIPQGWRPRDRTRTSWELAQALNRALNNGGGVSAAGALLAEAPDLAADACWLASRLFRISEDRRMADEALGWGNLAEAWGEVEKAANEGPVAAASPAAQPELL